MSTSSLSDPKPEHNLQYHVDGMFVHPSVRHHGLGRFLMQAALDFIQADALKHGQEFIRVELMVHESNDKAVSLYSIFGFKAVDQIRDSVLTMYLIIHV